MSLHDFKNFDSSTLVSTTRTNGGHVIVLGVFEPFSTS